MAEHERRYKIRVVHGKNEVDVVALQSAPGDAGRSQEISVQFLLVQPSSELIRHLAMSLLRAYRPSALYLLYEALSYTALWKSTSLATRASDHSLHRRGD